MIQSMMVRKERQRKPSLSQDESCTVSEPTIQGWYWTSATYKAIVGDGERKRHLWQDIVFIFHINKNDNVEVVASSIAQKKEHTYKNSKGEDVKWTFQKINQIEELFDDEPQDGTEVYWKFYEKVDKDKC